METTIFKAVEESIQEVVNRKGGNYWYTLHSARKLIGNAYSDQKDVTKQKATTIPFSQEALRWAYVHLYVTPHVCMMVDALELFWTSSWDFRTWIKKLAGGHVRVCCVGGGPGTDLLGLALFIRKHRLNLTGIQGHVLDQWTQWEETFCTLARHFDTQGLVLPAGGMGINYWELHFHTIWEQHTPTWAHLQRLQEADLVTMIKFVSAVASDKKILLQLMKPGALLFFLDNAGGGCATIVRHAAATAGFYEIGKFEHKDVKLPDNEATAIASSKLRLPKTKSDKTWKISAYLWQKGEKDKTSSGKRSQKQPKQKSKTQKQTKQKTKTDKTQGDNPTSSQRPLRPSPDNPKVRNKKTVLPQFRITRQQINIPQASENAPIHSAASQPKSKPQIPNSDYKLPQSLPSAAQAPTNNLAQSQRTGYQSITASTYSAPTTENNPSPVQTTQPNSVHILPQSYQSDYIIEHRFAATTSYQNYNPDATRRAGDTKFHDVNHQPNLVPNSRPVDPLLVQEEDLGCCATIMAALRNLCK